MSTARIKKLQWLRRHLASERQQIIDDTCARIKGARGRLIPQLSTMDSAARPYFRRAERALAIVDELIAECEP